MKTNTKLIIATTVAMIVGFAFDAWLQSQMKDELARAAQPYQSEEFRQNAAEHMRMVPFVDCAVAVITCGTTCVILWLPVWIPCMWRGALNETHHVSWAIQGKLEQPPENRHHGEGIYPFSPEPLIRIVRFEL